MKLKSVIRILTLMMFCSSSMFAFDLSSNHFGAFERLLKGRQTYKPSLVFPLSSAIQVDSNYSAEFYSEKLPPILTEHYSKFYLYTKGLQIESTTISINNSIIEDSNVSIVQYYEHNDSIQVTEIKVSNAIIQADEVSKITVKSDNDLPFWIYKKKISNHFKIYPSQIISKIDGDFYREYTVVSHCFKNYDNVSIELRNHRIDLQFEQGFQIQTFKLPLIENKNVYNAQIFVNGLLFGHEEINEPTWVENSIHLIPVVHHSKINHFSSNYPLEINNSNSEIEISDLNHETFSRELNYSIYPSRQGYSSTVGFLQEENINKFSTVWLDKPYPSRETLGRLMDLNVKTLGYFQRDLFGYPEHYNNQNNIAYFYEDAAERELLVYKQYDATEYKSKHQLEDYIRYHEYDLGSKLHPYNQSVLFIHVESENDIESLNSFIDSWNSSKQSPQLSLNNFNQFGTLFKNKNRTKINRSVKVESPFRQEYNFAENSDKRSNWPVILSNGNKLLSNNTISVFNPSSSPFEGIVEFKHASTLLKSAKWKDGTPLKLQHYESNTYYIQIDELDPFEIKTIMLSEQGVKTKGKLNYLGINKRSGIVNWQYKGNRLSKKKQDLFVSHIKDQNDDLMRSDKGKLKNKGVLFSNYERLIVDTNGQELQVNTLVFNDAPKVKYLYRLRPNMSVLDHSIHIQFNYPVIPLKYSIDRLYKEEFGYSKYGNVNVLESEESIFLFDNTKVLISSPQFLKWQYNGITYNTNEVGFIESSTFPLQLYLLVFGNLESNILKEDEYMYELNVLLGSENEDLIIQKQEPIFMESLRLKKPDLILFKIDNKKIKVVNIHPTEKENQYIIELKNISDHIENTNFTPRRQKSTVYDCLFSGKKTGIVKGKIKFEPQELKTIRISL